MTSTKRKTAILTRQDLESLATTYAALEGFSRPVKELVAAGKGMDTLLEDLAGPLRIRRSLLVRLVAQRLGRLDEFLSLPLRGGRFHGILRREPESPGEAFLLGVLVAAGRLSALTPRAVRALQGKKPEGAALSEQWPEQGPEQGPEQRLGRQDWAIEIPCPTMEIFSQFRSWFGLGPPTRGCGNRVIRVRSSLLGWDWLGALQGTFPSGLVDLFPPRNDPFGRGLQVGFARGLVASSRDFQGSKPALVFRVGGRKLAESCRVLLLGLAPGLQIRCLADGAVRVGAPVRQPAAAAALDAFLKELLAEDRGGPDQGTPTLPAVVQAHLGRLKRQLGNAQGKGVKARVESPSPTPQRLRLGGDLQLKVAREACLLERAEWRAAKKKAQDGRAPAASRQLLLEHLNSALREWAEREGWAYKPLPSRTLAKIQSGLLGAYLLRLDQATERGRKTLATAEGRDYAAYRRALGLRPGSASPLPAERGGRPSVEIREILRRLRCWSCGIDPSDTGHR